MKELDLNYNVNSVRNSVWISVENSVYNYVLNSVWISVFISVRNSVLESIETNMKDKQ